MHREADRLDARQIGGEAIGRRHLVMSDAELVALAAGRDAVERPGVDIGVDADRDPRGLPARRRQFAELMQLGHRLDIDLVNVRVERRVQFGAGLADARKDDALRRNPGGERAPHLAFGNHIGTGTETGEDAQHRQVRIGLDRIADQRPNRRQGIVQRAVLPRERRRRIKIERRADRFRDVRDRHLLGA